METILSTETMETITEKLSQKEDLYFPRKVQPSQASTPSLRKSLLLDLLSRDAAVFLERYGSRLSLEELKEFEVLKDDYKINWHLNHIRSIINPTEEDVKLRSAKVKNRRLAYMDRLIIDGSYFSEDAMREREPYLHHEYVGKFQDLSGRRMARPGERWSETLIRRAEEAILVEKIRGEQQRLGVAQSDWVGNEPPVIEEQHEEEEEEEESEEDSDEGKETEDKKVGTSVKSSENPEVQVDRDGSTAEPRGVDRLSLEEMTERLDQFTHIMQEKFLLGEDHQHLDYSRIDEDETLDDHWMKEVNQDAEEKYFDDV